MTFRTDHTTLHGLRIVLSGAVPPQDEWDEPGQDRAILEFVRNFAALVFKEGGRVVHGSHPTFAPVLAEQAQRFSAEAPHGSPLLLVMSALFEHLVEPATLEFYGRTAEFRLTAAIGHGGPEVEETRNASLTSMRGALIARADALVAIGGLRKRAGLVPGVDEEIEIARKRRIPCFLVGGMGGQTERLAQRELARCSDGNLLTPEQRDGLATTRDSAGTAGLLVRHLLLHHQQLRDQATPLDARDYYDRQLRHVLDAQLRQHARDRSPRTVGVLASKADTAIRKELQSAQVRYGDEVEALVEGALARVLAEASQDGGEAEA